MGNPTFRWSVHGLCRLIERMLSNKFDCVIIIEGNRGSGKSTLGYKICNGMKEINPINPDGSSTPMKMKFTPKKDILYKRSDIIDAFNQRWYSIFMGDELINVLFNRDFYSEDQKKLIKIVNMTRDHCNLFVACVPMFATLDNQFKNLCKIRISIVKRGVAIIQTQNRSIYSTDRWDSGTNEKIERKWIEEGSLNPKYSRLTTFRGILKFGDLSPLQRIEYEEIKKEQRNQIRQEEEAMEDASKPADRIYKLLTEGKIGNQQMFDNLAFALGMKPLNVMQNIRIRMRNDGDNRKFREFFTDDNGGYGRKN